MQIFLYELKGMSRAKNIFFEFYDIINWTHGKTTFSFIKISV